MNLDRWPKPLDPMAYHGVLGAIVRKIAPETEADPAAILVQLLVMFGNAVGRTPHFRVGADVHHLNLFAVVVGTSAKARKGMSKRAAQALFGDVDSAWAGGCITRGLSSGEGLIWAIRDPITKQQPIREKGSLVRYETVIEDAGVEDKRLMVTEDEFALVLKVITREGNTLSPVIRTAWDGEDLRTLTKSSIARATGPHISLIAHITEEELRRDLAVTEMANGFGNRFLWVLAKRSRELPHGGAAVQLDDCVQALARAVVAARRGPELRRDGAANRLWEQIYGRLSAARPGLLGAMTARAEAQVMRLAALYALADESSHITVAHLRAGLALWRYAFESARCLFGDRLGDPVADPILAQLRKRSPESVTRTEISQLFNRHKPAHEIERGLAKLLDLNCATVDTDRAGDGRPVERWRYCDREIGELSELSLAGLGDSSLNSLVSRPGDGRAH